MEFILASVGATPLKIPFLLRVGIPALLASCVVIGVATLVVLIKRSLAEKHTKETEEDIKSEAEASVTQDEEGPLNDTNTNMEEK